MNDRLPSAGSGYPRAILHADADAFFASVEQALDPSLRGRPVAVGAERGLAVSVSYEAKRLGVVRGMPAWEIRRKCPSCVIAFGHYDAYGMFSERMMSILRRFAPDVEESSIDEAFADLSGLTGVHAAGYPEIAARIQASVKSELGITISLGVSLTRTLAKICSRRDKPEGLTFVPAEGLGAFLARVDVAEIPGIGPSAQAVLYRQGIRTALDYTGRPERFLRALLGKTGGDLWQELRGRGVYAIAPPPKPAASLQRARTFTPSTGDRAFVRAQAFDNLESAFARLRSSGFRAGSIGLMLKDAEFRCHGSDAALPRGTEATLEAAPVLAELFDRLYRSDLKYRQTTVWLGRFEAARDVQRDLFEDLERSRGIRTLTRMTDRINERYGRRTLRLGSSFWRSHEAPEGQERPSPEADTDSPFIRVPAWKINV